MRPHAVERRMGEADGTPDISSSGAGSPYYGGVGISQGPRIEREWVCGRDDPFHHLASPRPPTPTSNHGQRAASAALRERGSFLPDFSGRSVPMVCSRRALLPSRTFRPEQERQEQSGRKIQWMQSRPITPGTVVAITTAKRHVPVDMSIYKEGRDRHTALLHRRI